MDDPLINPIEESFDNLQNDNDVSLNLFTEGDIDQKTDINQKELVIVNSMAIENEILNDLLGIDLYGNFLNSFKKHKVSLDRKSRIEFVDVNKRDNFTNNVDKMSSIKNLVESRT